MTSEKITKYELLDGLTTASITSEVNNHICKGAIPFGSPFKDGHVFCQAVVYVNQEIIKTGPL